MRAKPKRRVERAALVVGALLALLGVVALAALSYVTASRQKQTVGLGTTPGIDSSSTTVAGDPFVLAGPREGSDATTIPGTLPGQETVPPPPPTTTPAPTTSAPGPLVVPNVSGITSICGFEQKLSPYEKLMGQPPDKAAPLMVGLIAAVERYMLVAPDPVRADLVEIERTFQELSDILAANGWETTSAAFLDRVSRFRTPAELAADDSLPTRLTRVVTFEQETCG